MSSVKQYPPVGFSERLYNAWVNSGLDLTELSRRSGVARSSLYYYMYDGVSPNISVFARICKVLKVSSDFILFGKEA